MKEKINKEEQGKRTLDKVKKQKTQKIGQAQRGEMEEADMIWKQ